MAPATLVGAPTLCLLIFPGLETVWETLFQLLQNTKDYSHWYWNYIRKQTCLCASVRQAAAWDQTSLHSRGRLHDWSALSIDTWELWWASQEGWKKQPWVPAERICCQAETKKCASMRCGVAKDIQAFFSVLRAFLRTGMGESLVDMKKKILSKIKADNSVIQPKKERKAEVARTRKEVKTNSPPPRHKLDLLRLSPITWGVAYQWTLFQKESKTRLTALTDHYFLKKMENLKTFFSFAKESLCLTNVRELEKLTTRPVVSVSFSTLLLHARTRWKRSQKPRLLAGLENGTNSHH